MKIAGLKKFSMADYPGEHACCVYLAGCNYQCPWCGYGSYLENKGEGIPEESFWHFLEQQVGNLTACVVSGGEPTIYNDLPDFLSRVKKKGYKVKLETNGSNPEMIENLIKNELVDYISLDLKAPKEKYGYLIGFPEETMNYLLSKIERSIALLKEDRVDYEFKTTIGTYLSPNDVLEIAQWIRPAKKYILVNFNPERTLSAEFAAYKPYQANRLVQMRDKIASFFDVCEIKR